MSTSTKEPSAKRKSGDDAPTPQKKLSPQTISYLKDWIMSPEHMVRDESLHGILVVFKMPSFI